MQSPFVQRLSVGNQFGKLDAYLSRARVSVFFLSILAYIALAMHFPVSIYSLAGHDDALFFSHAYNLVKGNWLGAYDQMIIAKGPGFSFFLALNAALGLPITLSLALLHCFSTWLISTRACKLGLSNLLTIILFSLILFCPQSFPTRVIRDDIYPALTLIIVSGLIDLFLLRDRSIVKAFFYGSCIGLFWITREEGVWIGPATGLFLSVIMVSHVYSRDHQEIKHSFLTLAKLVGFSSLPILVICSINWLMYGGFVVVDFKEPNFSRSLSLLNAIEPPTRTSHVPVNKQQREIAYKVSPTFSKLQHYFENEGLHWTSPGCNVYPNTCGDYAGGWFMWAYRDAVAQQGMYSSFKKAQDFFAAVNREIESACESKSIKCRSAALGFLPHLDASSFAAATTSFFDAYQLLSYQSGLHMTGGPSMDANNILYPLRIFLGNPLSMPSAHEQIVTFRGWYYSKSQPDFWLSVICSDGNKEVIRQSSPDIAKAMSNNAAIAQRFVIEIPEQDRCHIQLASGQKISFATLKESSTGAILNDSQDIFYLDSARFLFPQQILRLSSKIKTLLGKLYSIIIPVLLSISVITLIGTLAYLVKQRCFFQPVLMVAILAWTLVFTRMVLLVLIDISSFPAINALYMGPAFSLSILAMITTIASFLILSSKPKAI